MIIGSHVGFKDKQLLGSALEAVSYGANTFMFYTGAPQNTMRKEIDDKLLNEAMDFMKEQKIDINNVICHAPYIVNLANKENESAWNFSIAFIKQELSRIEKMHVKYLVLHPGNALKQERNVALHNISDALNFILNENKNSMILLETMAGKGSECGITINELKEIIDNVNLKEKVGICLDTCHLNDSGVDISKFNDYLNDFNEIIGLDKIKCIHINDSKNEISSHKDRHENIGYGTIGFDNLINVIYNPLLKDIPKILETPYYEDMPPYKFEIEMIKNKKFNNNLYEDLKKYYK